MIIIALNSSIPAALEIDSNLAIACPASTAPKTPNIEGQPLWLRSEGIHHHLTLWQPWAFCGVWALGSEGAAYVLAGSWLFAGKRDETRSRIVWSSLSYPAKRRQTGLLSGDILEGYARHYALRHEIA